MTVTICEIKMHGRELKIRKYRRKYSPIEDKAIETIKIQTRKIKTEEQKG